jgi:hypothetical protein
MAKLLLGMSFVGIAVLVLGGAAMAEPPVGPGWHYTLNLNAVVNPKTADMTGSERHTIFVRFSPNTGTVTSRIYLREGDFQVCDGNAFDCAGNKIAQQGATFQLPNNNCTDVAGVCSPATLTCTAGTVGLPCAVNSDCDASCAIVDPEFTCYQVFIRELGGPCTPLIDTDGDGVPDACATLQTCGIEDLGPDGLAGTADDTVACSTENVLLVRAKGKPIWRNVTQELTSLCLDTDLNGQCDTRVELFENDFEEVFWEFTNTHLRRAQLRFYPTAGDACNVK